MDLRPMKIEYAKLLDENMGRTLFDINHNSIVFGSTSKSKGNKSKNKRVSQVALLVKKLPANAEELKDKGSVPGLGRYHGEGHGNHGVYAVVHIHHGILLSH